MATTRRRGNHRRAAPAVKTPAEKTSMTKAPVATAGVTETGKSGAGAKATGPQSPGSVWSGQDALGPLVRANDAIVDGAASLLSAWQRYAAQNIDTSVALCRAMVDAPDARRTARLQAEFLNAAADRWVRQGARLNEVTLTTATDLWGIWVARAETSA